MNSGIILPSLKENFLQILNSYNNSDQDKFVSAVDSFFKLIPSSHNILENDIAVKPAFESSNFIDEYDLHAVDKESLTLHKKAKNLMNEQNISYKEAIVNLSKITCLP